MSKDIELIERVAKALHDQGLENTDYKWEDLPEQSNFITSKEDYREMAEAVIYLPQPKAGGKQ